MLDFKKAPSTKRQSNESLTGPSMEFLQQTYRRSFSAHAHTVHVERTPVESPVTSPQGALALNAAILGTVLLGSRLTHALDVFAFMTLAMT